MKLGTFAVDTPVGSYQRIGIETSAGVVDATAARISFLERQLPASTASRVGTAQVPENMIEVVAAGPAGLEWIREAVQEVISRGISATSTGVKTIYDIRQIRLLAPVPRPPGLTSFNCWPEHIRHSNQKGFALAVPDEALGPQSYWKGNADGFTGPGVTLEYPKYATELDVECELVAIVGTGGKDLNIEQAEKAIAGYSIMNDVSVRDIQMREMKSGRGPAKGKDFDLGNPLGPWLVTPDEVGDPKKLRYSLIVNDEELSSQDGSGMAFTFPQMLAYVSQGQTIRPGHVITGGSYYRGSGFDLDRQFHPGDKIELKISNVGSLVNTIGNPRTAEAVRTKS